MQVKPLSYLNSVCGPLEGPHIDVLETLAKTASISNTMSKITQKMQYWGVVSEGKLLIFRHFGDKDPKVVVDLGNVGIKKGEKPGGRTPNVAKFAQDTAGMASPGGTTRGTIVDGERRETAVGSTVGWEGVKDKAKRSTVVHQKRPSVFAAEHNKAFSYMREFVLKSSDLASSNRQRYSFEAPTVGETRHWFEVIEYWADLKKKAKGGRNKRGTNGSFRSTTGGARAKQAGEEAARESMRELGIERKSIARLPV